MELESFPNDHEQSKHRAVSRVGGGYITGSALVRKTPASTTTHKRPTNKPYQK